MNGKVVLVLALIGLTNYASALCQCKPVSNEEVWQNATVVAHVKINKVTRPGLSLNFTINQSGKKSNQTIQQSSQSEQVTYEVTYIEIYKPKGVSNSSQSSTIVTPASTLDCGVPFLAQNVEYLIVANRQNNKLQLSSCQNFPIINNTISTGPLLWNVVSQDLKQKLSNGSF